MGSIRTWPIDSWYTYAYEQMFLFHSYVSLPESNIPMPMNRCFCSIAMLVYQRVGWRSPLVHFSRFCLVETNHQWIVDLIDCFTFCQCFFKTIPSVCPSTTKNVVFLLDMAARLRLPVGKSEKGPDSLHSVEPSSSKGGEKITPHF